MVAGRTLSRAALVVLMAAAPAVWYACSSDGPSAPPPEPVNPRIPVADLRAAIAAQRRHTDALLLTPGVIGTAVAPLEGGGAGMLILLERPGIPGRSSRISMPAPPPSSGATAVPMTPGVRRSASVCRRCAAIAARRSATGMRGLTGSGGGAEGPSEEHAYQTAGAAAIRTTRAARLNVRPATMTTPVWNA